MASWDSVLCTSIPNANLHAHREKERERRERERQSLYLHTITAQAANPIEEGKHSARAKTLLISQ